MTIAEAHPLQTAHNNLLATITIAHTGPTSKKISTYLRTEPAEIQNLVASTVRNRKRRASRSLDHRIPADLTVSPLAALHGDVIR